jgi:hypothetical protein
MAKGKGAKTKALDFSNVKERGDIAPVHKPEGDYSAKVMSVADIKMGPEKRDAWLYIIKVGAGTYPYRCGFNDNELWKIRNLFVAAGVAVPKKRQTINPNSPVGRSIAVTLQDHLYDKVDGKPAKLSSEIAAVFPPSELDGEAGSDDDEVADYDGEDEEPEAPPKKKAKKGKPAPEPAPAKKNKKGKGKKMESLDIDEL